MKDVPRVIAEAREEDERAADPVEDEADIELCEATREHGSIESRLALDM
jgi:hypothetical protein